MKLNAILQSYVKARFIITKTAGSKTKTNKNLTKRLYFSGFLILNTQGAEGSTN